MVGVMTLLFGAWLLTPLQQSGFTGVWERDVERSDDPQEKMQAAMEQMRERMGRRRPGRRGGFGPPGGRGGRRSDPREGGGRPDLGGVADKLLVEMTDGEFHVDDGERLNIYYLDGEEHKREMANGTPLESVAELRANAVVIEESMARGSIDRKFELSRDGETLVMTLTVRFGRMPEPVVIETVYQRASAESY